MEGASNFTRKQLDKLTDFVRSQQVGAKGLVYCKFNEDGTTKSSIDKFYDESQREAWGITTGCKKGDLLLVLSGTSKAYTKSHEYVALRNGR